MKIIQWRKIPITASLLTAFCLLAAPTAKAQWAADGPPDILEHQFITEGGISYFRLVALLSGGYCCQRIAGYDVLRQGSSLTQVLEEQSWAGYCIAEFC